MCFNMTTRWCQSGLFFLKEKKSALLECNYKRTAAAAQDSAETQTVTLSEEKTRLKAPQRTVTAEPQLHS